MRQKIHKRKVSFSKIQFLTFICIFAATGGYWLLSSHAATIWYVSTSGSGTVCSQAQPCASFDQAYQNASTGDTVQVAAGTYSSQSISSSNANISGMVTFQPCNGCSVIVQGISISSPWITINNMTSYPGDNHEVKTGPNQALGVMVSSSNVTLNNVNSKGAYVWDMIYNSTNIIWNGGEVLTPGVVGLRDCLGTDNDQLPLSILGGTNITLDSMHFHVAASSQQACTNGNQSSNGVHLEMVRADSVKGLTVQNSIFDDQVCPPTITAGCGDSSNTIFISNNHDGTWPTNLTFRNNFFGSDQNPTFSSGIPDCTGYVWAYNTHHDTPGDSCIANGTWIGNLAPRPGYYTCEGTHTKNVWQDSINYTCGSDKVIVGTRFASDSLGLGGSDGFHLTASSPAIDAAESGGYCTSTLGAKDIDGNSRPQGAACDAGADEYTPSANVWISATGSDTTCVRGDSTKPCASFNKACSIAQGGDIVQVADGTYPSQDLSTCTGKTSTVTFKPVSGHECPYSAATPWSSLPAQNSDTSCDVTLGDLTLYNQSYPSMTTPTDIVNSSLKNLDFKGMYATTVTVGFAHNITLDHMAATDFYVSASDTVTIQNSDFGNVYNGDCSTVSNRGNTPTPYPDSSNVTIKGNIFHDSMRLTSAQSHPDGLFIQGLNGGVIDGNVFYRDAVLPLYLNSVAGGSIQNISITNNLIHDVVDMTDTGSSTLSQPQGNFSPQTISLGDNNISNITVAFNSVSGWIRRQDNTQSGGNGTGTTTNLQVYGNIAQGYVYGNSYGCSINTAFDYNYWYGGSGSKCGIHDSLGSGSSPFTVADTWTASGSYYTVAPGNYSLKTATVPIDFVPTSFCTANAGICPTADFSSLARPYGAAYDAGAEELGATGTPTTPGDLNSDGHVNITDLSIILTNWATSNPTCDLNANGTVDIFDLSILLSHFGI